MRRNILSGFFMALMVAAPAAFAADKEPRLITVSGSADVKTPPDEVVVIFGVETKNRELTAAKEENDRKVKSLLGLGPKLDIDRKYFQTDYLSIEPQYNPDNSGETARYYGVRTNIAVTLKDTAKLEKLIGQALDAGANYINGIQFRTTQFRKLQDQARIMAVKAAREKAEALAAELGQKIGRPYSIQETDGGWQGPMPGIMGKRFAMAANAVQNMGGIGAAGDEAVSLGQINISASVSVSFELLD